MFHEPGADGAGFEGCLYHYADGAMSSEDGTVHEYAASGAVPDATPEPEAEPEREPEPESESSKIPAFVEYTPSDVRSYLLATVFVLAAVASVLTLFVSAPDANTAGFVVAAGLAILALAAWSGLAGRNPRSYRSAKVPARWPAVHAYTPSTCATQDPHEARREARLPSWQAVSRRPDGRTAVIGAQQVKARHFSEIVEYYRDHPRTPDKNSAGDN